MKRIICFTGIIIFLFITVSSCSAITRSEVLGVQTNTENIPPTVEGPGFLLPDSPFYFLDKIKQGARVAFAYGYENKARVYANIAGERMAELRFMLLKQNDQAVKISLNGISESFKEAEKQLKLAKMSGQNVNLLAKEINDSIRDKQQTLDELALNKNGEMSMEIQATVESLTTTKIKVEEYLAPEDLKNEINYDLNRELELSLYEATVSAQSLEAALEELKTQKQETVEQSFKDREEAVTTEEQEQKELEKEKAAWQKSLLLTEETIKQVSTNVQKAQEAALKYQGL